MATILISFYVGFRNTVELNDKSPFQSDTTVYQSASLDFYSTTLVTTLAIGTFHKK